VKFFQKPFRWRVRFDGHVTKRREEIKMKSLAEFTKRTLIGGILIVLPVYTSLLLLAKAVTGLLALLKPITAGMPASLEFREVLANTTPIRDRSGRCSSESYECFEFFNLAAAPAG
jgi:hypothetical protein